MVAAKQIPIALNLNYQSILTYDADRLDADIAVSAPYLWKTRVTDIADILISNSIKSRTLPSETSPYSVFFKRPSSHRQHLLHSWLNPRELSLGEVSVLLKHHSALSMIANGSCSYGLIIEDDARLAPNTASHFANAVSQFIEMRGDYLDLAGGCSLLPTEHDLEYSYITRLAVARTRTNAAYMVSRQLAQRLSNRFFPLVFPIDWHLQYLFEKADRCFWSNQPVLIHGSEQGLVQSWRN